MTAVLGWQGNQADRSRGLTSSTILIWVIALVGLLVAFAMPLIMHALGY